MATPTIRRRLHLAASPAEVHARFATAAGRRSFWAAEAEEAEGVIHLVFPSGERLDARILENEPPHRFAFTYFGGSRVRLELAADGRGGTDLTLTATGVPAEHHDDDRAGWVAVLLQLKASVDHGVDLRNHDPERTWEWGWVDV